jgi:hypothetical protein
MTTTTFGSWANITTYSLTPAQYVADALGDYPTDYDVEAIIGEFLAAIQARLPAGLTILGNGELIGPAYGPERDALPEDVCAHVMEIIAGEGGIGDGIDLQSIADAHDLTERAAVLLTYRLGADGRFTGELVTRQPIENFGDAQQILRDLDDDPDAGTLNVEPGTRLEKVVTDNTGRELASSTVIAQ